MADRDFVKENEASRREMSELISRLDERSFQRAVGSGWTVATLLCHIAFWDQRVLFLLGEWQKGKFEATRFTHQLIDSINEAVKAVSIAVPGPAAAKLALESAEAVDLKLAKISDELIARMMSADYERSLKRFLHRREHLEKMKGALEG